MDLHLVCVPEQRETKHYTSSAYGWRCTQLMDSTDVRPQAAIPVRTRSETHPGFSADDFI